MSDLHLLLEEEMSENTERFVAIQSKLIAKVDELAHRIDITEKADEYIINLLERRITGIEKASVVSDIDTPYLFLDERDVRNMLDALKEWEEVMGSKELSVSDVGLDWERYEELTKRMKEFTK